ncbi:cyclopropane-fatty-acyl-phospholipid synthase [Lasiosphaeria hispida]|uniref:Cyclopropane-fatty-acyl-phospholipid synthase n=1 Tax=Lasiosphaeria hispida TaxID=260671 RepID=A0AAJ0MIM6_9PEZI|nr:cyclopropane-fatty-acyl-phospholipid synthase [Lasiosphaeria hispida]
MATLEPPITVKYLDTAAAYDLWSSVYDTDSNFLQALDSLEMASLLPELTSLIASPKPWKLVDLGCGTGRNTVHLVALPDVEVIGLDLSPKMLEVARGRLEAAAPGGGFLLRVFDVSNPGDGVPQGADAVVSTLVLEHVALGVYFAAAAGMLKEGGLLLVTNMHEEMGRISQAGFIDPHTGEKIRPKSYAHSIEEVVAEAGRNGFEVVEGFWERRVTEENWQSFGPRAEKWVGIKVWYGGILRKTATS